jgi:ABC-2 type transport system ATP-binding protein
MSTIEIQHVTKRFGQVVGVSDVDFVLEPGVTGLLGPNGAGKSTLLKMMAGLIEPSMGHVRVLGEDLRQNSKLYSRIGYCPESDPFYGYMTGFEFLLINAKLHGLSDPEASATAALELVDLAAQRDKKVRAYSRGMRQRLKVAQTILHDPEVLLFDEPLKGADPTQRKILLELILELGSSGKTVIVSSHILNEVERMASQIILINRGRLMAFGDFHAIRKSMEDRPHKVMLMASEPHKLAAALTAQALVSGIDLLGEEMLADVTNPDRFYSELPKVALEAGVRLTKISSMDDDLESVFRYLVG